MLGKTPWCGLDVTNYTVFLNLQLATGFDLVERRMPWQNCMPYQLV